MKNATQEIIEKIMGNQLCEGYLETEGENWNHSSLALINAVLDTVVPGARLVCIPDQGLVYLAQGEVWKRDRDLVQSLRDLADSLEKGGVPIRVQGRKEQ